MQKPPFRKEGAKRERANWIGISQKADLTSCKCDCAFSPSGCSQTRMRWVEIRKESKHAVCAEKTLKEFFFFFLLVLKTDVLTLQNSSQSFGLGF